MNHLVSCTLVASIALTGIALDSKSWTLTYPGLPHSPLIESASTPSDTPQRVYHFSGRSDTLTLTDGKVVLDNSLSHTKADTFDCGTLTATLPDVTAYSYTYTVTKDGTTYLLASGSGEGTMNNIYQAPMGIATKSALLNSAGISVNDLKNTLTLTLTTTHTDGTVQTHTLPLSLQVDYH